MKSTQHKTKVLKSGLKRFGIHFLTLNFAKKLNIIIVHHNQPRWRLKKHKDTLSWVYQRNHADSKVKSVLKAHYCYFPNITQKAIICLSA